MVLHLSQDETGGVTPGRWMTAEELHTVRAEVFGMSRREFMVRTGVSDSSIGRYEREEQPCPPWLGLVVSAAIMGLPPYTGSMREVAEHLVRLQSQPPEARLALLAAAFASAAAMSGSGDGTVSQLAAGLRGLVDVPASDLNAGA